MKKVGVIGASGMAGSAIYQLASADSNLDVIGIVRNEKRAKEVLGDDANLLITGDVLNLSDAELARFDVIIDAFGTAPANADQQIKLAEKLINVARQGKIRVIFILGAGSLHTGEDNHLVVDDLAKLPNAETWINTPKQQLKELEFLETVDDADWLGISPAMTFESGPATDYELGQDELLFNSANVSRVTSGTMAKLVVSEVVDPQHHQERITLVNEG
ncbi:NAD(P)-dependent oxidoreductase [Limosilactobacillus caecicola]|uniref:NAD(P)-dependent oxidoreductase n=1 Tax=Limosilactobacillus caecicola TaxID=2941332 RepID=UPI00203ADEC2|nr:NAD(P)H-binding protein [Limosilactobacillus caecicola]